MSVSEFPASVESANRHLHDFVAQSHRILDNATYTLATTEQCRTEFEWLFRREGQQSVYDDTVELISYLGRQLSGGSNQPNIGISRGTFSAGLIDRPGYNEPLVAMRLAFAGKFGRQFHGRLLLLPPTSGIQANLETWAFLKPSDTVRIVPDHMTSLPPYKFGHFLTVANLSINRLITPPKS